jgi:hypothetical protein
MSGDTIFRQPWTCEQCHASSAIVHQPSATCLEIEAMIVERHAIQCPDCVGLKLRLKEPERIAAAGAALRYDPPERKES